MSFKTHALTAAFALVAGAGLTVVAADQYVKQKAVTENNPCAVYQVLDQRINAHYAKVNGEASGSAYKETEFLGMKGCVVAAGSKQAPAK